MRVLLFVFITISALFSCKDDDTQTPVVEVTDLDIVTGVVLTDDNGQGIGSVGNPNWYNGLILYPNPPGDVQTAALQSGLDILEIRIVEAEKNMDFNSSEVMNAFNSFEGYDFDEEDAETARFIGSTGGQQLQYRLDGLSPGYYRVIATDESDVQHGSTIFINSTLAYPMGLRDFLFSDWQ